MGHKRFMTGFLGKASAFIFLGSMLSFVLSVGLYIRSLYRSDILTIILPGQHCVILQSDMDDVGIGWESPWVGPRLMALNSSLAINQHNFKQYFETEEYNKLRGPQFFRNLNSLAPEKGFYRLIGSNFPVYFVYRHDPKLEVFYDAGGSMTIDNTWRRCMMPLLVDEVPFTEATVDAYLLFMPIWLLPWLTAMIPILWLLTAGRRRWRRSSRRRNGLCIHCGYDLRGTPAKCPECGRSKVGDRAGSNDWRIAFLSLAAFICIFELLLRSEF